MADCKNELKKQKYVEGIARHGNAVRACEEAGYSPRSNYLLQRDPLVIKMLQELRDKFVEKTGYDLAAAMAEADDGIQFAKLTENANAYAKFVELKMKLQGLLVEKVQVAVSGFVVQIEGIEEPRQLPPPAVSFPVSDPDDPFS